MSRFRRPDRPLVYGHRGTRGVVVENTLAAFEDAARAGADGVEFDVRVCKSGELVVLHDADLRRVTSGASDAIAHTTAWEDLRRVELPDGASVPLCADVVRFCRDRGMVANIEMKRDVPKRSAVVRAIAALLREVAPADDLIVSSFDPAMIVQLGLLDRRVTRALLVHRSSYHEVALHAPDVLRLPAIHIERTLTFPSEVRHHVARRLVNVWTVNDPSEARDLARLGVSGIITDRPAQILEALAC